MVTAYGDASWRYPIARGQYIQFGVASVITAGSFALIYLTAYYIAQRRPLRRKQSMEYQVHPATENWTARPSGRILSGASLYGSVSLRSSPRAALPWCI